MSHSKALSLGEYDKITLLKLLDRLGKKYNPEAEPQTDQNLMAKCCIDAAKMIRSLDGSANALCEVVGGHFMHAVKPTHYAVIDEHGEIVHAMKCETGRDSEYLCELWITQTIEYAHDKSVWTVKGVTVHE